MAFATSSSAFGIKPGSTTSTFNAPSTQPAGTFGVPSSQPSATSSLFGGVGQSTTQPPGQNQNQPQNQPTQGGFFTQQQQTLQQPQQPSGSLFGGGTWGAGAANAANLTGQPSQSGFGTWGPGASQPQSQQQQPEQSTTAFGSGNIFGASTQSQSQPQGSGLWGGSSAQPSLFGQPALTQTQSQQQQALPFTRTTKFNDLPDQVQKTFESIDAHIQGRIQISSDLKARSLGEEPTKAAELIRKVHKDLVNTMSNVEADKTVVEELKSKVDLSVQDTIITTRIIDGFRNPQQNGSYLKNHAGFPLEYFTRATEEIRQKLQWHKSTIEQVERRLASAQNQMQYNPQAITSTLQAQNATFTSLAAKTAELHAELQEVKAAYREMWRSHTGSARDPFDESHYDKGIRT